MKTINITDTCSSVVWKLKSVNIVVYTGNNDETKKLLENNCQKKVLRKKVKPLTRTFQVVGLVVCINSIDLAHQEIIMEKIRAKNMALIPSLEMKQIG